ncbi:MAG: flagellar hook-associated protein 3 [Chloroflexota bacterium]
MRISMQWMVDRTIANIALNLEKLVALQEQAASGKRLLRPEDDPAGVRRAISLRAGLAATQRYLDNIQDSDDWMSATDAALGHIADLMTKALTLAEKGASDTISADERRALAAEVDQLLQEAISTGNTRLTDRYIFAGFKTTTQPFTLVPGTPDQVIYNGDSGQIRREIEPGETVTVNVTGDTAFPAVFEQLIGLRDDLLANDRAAVQARISPLQAAQQGVLDVQATVGARQGHLSGASERLENMKLMLTDLLSRVEDADMAETIVRLTEQETVYQAVLQASASAIPPSLWSFLQ